MNKILYHSESFYLLQKWPENLEFSSEYESTVRKSKANKIKIANQELLPLVRSSASLNASGLMWKHKNDTVSLIKDGDSFDFPDGISVSEIINKKTGRFVNIGGSFEEEYEEVAILSKSNDSKLSNSPEKPDFEKMIQTEICGYKDFRGLLVAYSLNYEHPDKVDYAVIQLLEKTWNDYHLTKVQALEKEIDRLKTLLIKCDTTFGLIRQVIDNVKEQREIDPELLHVVVDEIDIDFELIQAKIKDELRTKP